jgi:hypothetical protein
MVIEPLPIFAPPRGAGAWLRKWGPTPDLDLDALSVHQPALAAQQDMNAPITIAPNGPITLAELFDSPSRLLRILFYVAKPENPMARLNELSNRTTISISSE